jgi:hypothetical protein
LFLKQHSSPVRFPQVAGLNLCTVTSLEKFDCGR